MTLMEKMICTAYTGINFCGCEEDWDEFERYIEYVMGRPVQTFEMTSEGFWKKAHDLTKESFGRMLRGCYDGRPEWTPVTEALPDREDDYLVTVRNDCGTRRRQVSSFRLSGDGTCYSWGIETSPVYTVVAWAEMMPVYEEVNDG